MSEERARELVEIYIEGWRKNDKTKILKPLATHCFITESHGPTYRGVKLIEKWIDEWYQTGTVKKWDIDSFFFTKDTAFFEWSFTCMIGGKTDSIDGASVVQFKNNKIHHIHEYRMTRSSF